MLRFLFSAIFFLFFSNSVNAADVVISVTGSIKNESCIINTNDTNQLITLGDFQVRDFPQAGSTTAGKPLNIRLADCTETISGASVTFAGTASAQYPELLALSDTGNGTPLAGGIAIEILDGENEKPIALNTPARLKPIIRGENTLKYILRYKSINNTVTAGDASAIMYFDIVYQ
ncbi:fimbrial protein [Morganella psychrotolerans]|uniref:fimbrial protein n=1 Tax=Morganella psychrotolerans TaxID=368603 RepID=UPI0039B06121